MHLKISSAIWRPFCLGFNVLDVLNLRIKVTDGEHEEIEFYNCVSSITTINQPRPVMLGFTECDISTNKMQNWKQCHMLSHIPSEPKRNTKFG